MCWQAAETLACDVSASVQARRFVVRALSRVASSASTVPGEWRSLTEDAELVVSELTTNALQADCAQLQVILDLHRTELVVTVIDDAGGWPQLQEVRPTDLSGRGLHLVGVMSAQWGSDSIDTGKRVWARLPVPDTCAQWIKCEL